MNRVVLLNYLLLLNLVLYGNSTKLLEIIPVVGMEKIDFTPGLSLKVKHKLTDGKQFNLSIGGHVLYGREIINSTRNSYHELSGLYIEGISGYSQHICLDIVTEFLWLPIKHIDLFIGFEPYLGCSLFTSKADMDIPDLNIQESFSTEFSYIDYGISPLLKYKKTDMEFGFSFRFPLKYYIDYLFDTNMDGKNTMFLGFSFGYYIL